MVIALAAVASIAVYRSVPVLVEFPLESLLPFNVSEPARPAPRALALFLLPAVATVMWAAFLAARTAAGQRFGRRLFRNAPSAVTSPEQFDRFGKTYDAIVFGVVALIVGIHAAFLAAMLGYATMASRIIPVVLGGSLVLMGNVMPRLRANWVAGLRTQRTFEDPQLWRSAHRAFGAAFVVAGLVTIAVGLIAPSFGLVTGIAGVLASCIVGFVASTRRTLPSPPVRP